MAVQILITLLCGVGLYTALFMLRKTRRAERGELREVSVVQSSRARLFGSIPNAAIGALYYPALAVAVWFAPRPDEVLVLLLVAAAASLVSLVLAYSLLFITRMPCAYCWSAHAINWMLTGCLTFLYWSASWR